MCREEEGGEISDDGRGGGLSREAYGRDGIGAGCFESGAEVVEDVGAYCLELDI